MLLFNPRRNSIGFLRLLFAATVIVSHSWPLGGFGTDPGRVDNNLGFMAVEGFFALSGFLIASSGTRLGIGRFMWHRILRIFPGYWVALIVVALGFAPIAWHAAHSLRDYFASTPPPTGFLLNNWFLVQGQTGIGGTLDTLPFASMWNGPLYTLYYEFICYLIIALLMAARLLTGRIVAALAGVAWIWLQLVDFHLAGAVDNRQTKLTLCFLLGALIYFYRDTLLRKTIWMPVAAGIITIGSYAWLGYNQVGVITFCYLCLWAGAVLPFHRVGRRADLSYGMYIYGWPVLQLSVFLGIAKLGHPLFLLIVFAITIVLAAFSWFVVESPALRLKNSAMPRWLRSPVAAPK